MIYAKAGVGKTYLAMRIAISISSGLDFLYWRNKAKHKVLYIDGEMQVADMQKRQREYMKKLGVDKDTIVLDLFSNDHQENPLPNLSSIEGQADLNPIIGNYDMVIIDNISTLCMTGKENCSDNWDIMQNRLLDLRRRNIAVVIIHHGNKNNGFRGTSRMSDGLDKVISLTRDSDGQIKNGACFTLSFDKCRHLHGKEVEDLYLQLVDSDFVETSKFISERDAKTLKMVEQGISFKDIGQGFNISKQVVGNIVKKHKS